MNPARPFLFSVSGAALLAALLLAFPCPAQPTASELPGPSDATAPTVATIPAGAPSSLPAVTDDAARAVEAIRARETARATWLRRYVLLGFNAFEADTLTETTLRFASAPHFRAALETLLQSEAPSPERREAVIDLLNGERGRTLLALAEQLELLDADVDTLALLGGFRPPESWEEALRFQRQREAALREADEWLDALPQVALYAGHEEVLRVLRQAAQHPGALREAAALVRDSPDDLFNILDMAIAAPEHLTENWTNRKQRKKYLEELADRTGLKAWSLEDQIALWNLRDDEETLNALADLVRGEGWTPPVARAAAMWKQGPDVFKAWAKQWMEQEYAAMTFMDRMRQCSLDAVTLPLAQLDPDRASLWKISGVRSLHFTENAESRALLEGGSGTLPNGITVRTVPDNMGELLESFEGEAYILRADIPGDGGLGGGVSPWLPAVWSDEVDAALDYAQLLRSPEANPPARLDVLLFSDRSENDVAAHVAYLNAMLAPAQNPAADDPRGGARRQLPRSPQPPADAGETAQAPVPRLINFAGGVLFTALAEGLDREGAATLFGPLNAVCARRWTPDAPGRPGEWLCLSPEGRADVVGRRESTPMLSLPASCIPALNRCKAAIPPRSPSRENLHAMLTHWSLGSVHPAMDDAASVRAAFEEGHRLCDQADIREPGERDSAALLWTALRLGGRDAACEAMRACLLREGAALEERVAELPDRMRAADPTLWPGA